MRNHGGAGGFACLLLQFIDQLTPPAFIIIAHQERIASSNRRANSSGPAGRGDNFVTRCCGSVPSTNAGISALLYPTAHKPFGVFNRRIISVIWPERIFPASA